MIVYILKGNNEYEGFDILGIYESEDKARNAEIDFVDNPKAHYDDYTIDEHEVE